MSKERAPKTKILTHSAAVVGGVALGYMAGHRKLNDAHLDRQAAEFKAMKAQGEAEKDTLTQLYRRHVLQRDYQGLVSASHERDRSSEQSEDPKADKHVLLMLDLDNFSKINNTYGHNKGDQVLSSVAATIIKQIRNRDVPVRWGGEEIAVLLPRATETDGAEIAEELRESIADGGQVTTSIGVAEVNLNLSLEDNIALADRALYAAKEAGRNQVVAYSSLETRS